MQNGYYANCPKCGRKVLMFLPGSKVETQCDKCRTIIFAMCLGDGIVRVEVVPGE